MILYMVLVITLTTLLGLILVFYPRLIVSFVNWQFNLLIKAGLAPQGYRPQTTR